jgi:hypothetical protein
MFDYTREEMIGYHVAEFLVEVCTTHRILVEQLTGGYAVGDGID